MISCNENRECEIHRVSFLQDLCAVDHRKAEILSSGEFGQVGHVIVIADIESVSFSEIAPEPLW